MSKTPIFTQLFGRSPIAPIQHHMATCESCAIELIPFIRAVSSDNWTDAEIFYRKIVDFEQEADAVKKDIRLHLPSSLFLPIPRSNLLEILHLQDQIANCAKDIGGLMVGRKMIIPAEIQSPWIEFTEVSVAAVSFAKTAMDELNDLIVTGFSGREIEFIEKILEQLHEAEHASDELQVQVRQALFEQEGSLNPVDVMFLYRVIEHIGDLADEAQTVGNRMLYLIAS